MINLIGAFILTIVLLAIWKHGPGFAAFEEKVNSLPQAIQIAVIFLLLVLIGGRLLFGTSLHVPVLGFILTLLEGANFWIHEAGHGFLFFIGGFWMSFGGTLFELGLPLGIAVTVFRKRLLCTLTLTLFWLSISLQSVARYASDARAQRLELVGGGSHDWNFMLTQLGVLNLDYFFGWVFMALAAVSLCLAVAIYVGLVLGYLESLSKVS